MIIPERESTVEGEVGRRGGAGPAVLVTVAGLKYRVSHKRRPITKIFKVDIFNYLTLLFITE